ncbi:MAG: hypothetical protein L6290_10040 [Thermodesulfovibrionales bacterium]|nr:hypothetical protein [Thermodesulfovibrionales bacterium]
MPVLFVNTTIRAYPQSCVFVILRLDRGIHNPLKRLDSPIESGNDELFKIYIYGQTLQGIYDTILLREREAIAMFKEIRAQIERITYYNEENGYTVAKAKVGGRHGLVNRSRQSPLRKCRRRTKTERGMAQPP